MDTSQDSDDFANDAVEIGVLDSETSQQILDVVDVAAAAASNVTITINAKGEINVDQTALAELLGSDQKSARVTFVRIGEEGAIVENEVDLDASELLQAVGGDVGTVPGTSGENLNPMLLLDSDQMSRLESVLQSDEAKNFLGEALTTDEQTADDSQEDERNRRVPTRRSLRRQPATGSTVSNTVKTPVSAARSMKKTGGDNAGVTESPASRRRRLPPGTQKIVQEDASGPGPGILAADEPAAGPTSRPVRQRRLPAGLQDSHVESPGGSSSGRTTRRGRTDLKPGAAVDKQKDGLSDVQEARRDTKSQKEDEVEGDQVEEEEEEDDDDSGESWASEDDPDRLWCICKRPHNNRFMICCDICLDWFHGKCVGITKSKGKEMEEAGIDWSCKTCKEQVANTNTLAANSEQMNMETEQIEPEPTITTTTPSVDLADDEDHTEAVTPLSAARRSKTPASRGRKNSESQEKPKARAVRCHMCPKPPRQTSIYCSDACIKAHAAQALKLLKESNASKSNNTVVVLEPKTNTLLNGPNAPTQEKLQDWLAEHTSYHVVMPSQSSSAKFYAERKHKGPKIVDPHRVSTEDLTKRRHSSGDVISSLTPTKVHKSGLGFPTPSGLQRVRLQSKEEIQAEVKAQLKRAISKSGEKPSKAKRERRQSESRTPAKRRPKEPREEPPPLREENKAPDTRAVRTKVVKDVRDALNEKVEKCNDLKIEYEKIQKIAEEIEIAMFGTFGDIGLKYKNKYRSLVYNIKDVRNDGLFRRILLRDLSPIEVVSMSAEEYASKELHEWREATMKKDIEAIKSHELDLLALGNVYVMKSHKGEQVIEKEDGMGTTAADIKLPEDMAYEESKIGGPKTWDHPDHGDVKVEPLCDVCNGKMSLETFVNFKISKESGTNKKEKRSRSRSKERHRHHSKRSSSKHHSSRDKEKSSHHRDKSSRDRDHRSRDKEHDRDSSSRSKDHEKDRASREKEPGKDRSDHHKNRAKDPPSSRTSEKGPREKGKKGTDEGKRMQEREESSGEHRQRHGSGGSKHSSREKHIKDRHRHRSHDENRLDKDKERRSSSLTKGYSHSTKDETKASLEEKKDLQEKIEKATAAIEAAKKSGEEFNKVIEEKLKQRGSTPPDRNSPDLEEERGLAPPPVPSIRSSEAEVSSTVNIKTPEFTESDAPFSPEEEDEMPQPPFSPQSESAWRGGITMQDVAQFNVSAHEVRGPVDFLDQDLGECLTIVGRIPPAVVWDYIHKIVLNVLKEVIILKLDPRPGSERNYLTFYNYLASRDRFGVVGNANKKTVKDCYVLPLAGTGATIPPTLLDLEADLPSSRTDCLLCLIVRTRRDRGEEATAATAAAAAGEMPSKVPDVTAAGPSRSAASAQVAPYKPAHSRPMQPVSALPPRLPPPSAPAGQQKMSGRPGVPPPPNHVATTEDDEPYEPDDEEPYSPGNSPPAAAYAQAAAAGYTTNRGRIAGSESPQLLSVKTSDEGGFTEQLKKLQAEVDAKKLELARREAIRDTLMSGARTDYTQPPPILHQVSRTELKVSNTPAFCTDVGQPTGLDGVSGIALPAKMPIIPPIGMPVVPGMTQGVLVSSRPEPDLIRSKEVINRPLPPPGPGMPGNGKGQGIHNLELHREQEERLRHAGRGPWAGQEGRWHPQEYPHHPGQPVFRGRGHPPPWRGGGGDSWAGKRRSGGPGRGDWRDRRERDRREREWEEDEERERYRRRRSRSRSRSRSKSKSSRRSRSRSRSRNEGTRRVGHQPVIATEDWSDDEIAILVDEEEEASSFKGAAMETIPLNIPKPAPDAKVGPSGQQAVALARDLHKDVAAQLAHLDKEFRLPVRELDRTSTPTLDEQQDVE